jgi:hypothetical protein
MARKIVNRKALREEVEAAEKAAQPEAEAAKRKPTKRKSRKEPAEVRVKMLWCVYNQAMKPVAKFEYSQKDDADKKAAALTQAGKQPHFVAPFKEVIQEPK